jgi:hypothetical protein
MSQQWTHRAINPMRKKVVRLAQLRIVLGAYFP